MRFALWFIFTGLICCGKPGARRDVHVYQTPAQEQQSLDHFVSQLAIKSVSPGLGTSGVGQNATIRIKLENTDQLVNSGEYELQLLNLMDEKPHEFILSGEEGQVMVRPSGNLLAGDEYLLTLKRKNSIHQEVRATLAGFLVDIPFEENSLAVSETHACLTEGKAEIYCQQLASGNSGLHKIDSPGVVLSLAVSRHAACVLSERGEVHCWNHEDRVVKKKSGLLEIRKLVAYQDGFCTLSRVGGVFCFGKGMRGENGFRMAEATEEASQVTGLNAGVYDIASGVSHSCAAKSFGGGLICWGSNLSGGFFSDDNQKYLLPVPSGFPEQKHVRAEYMFAGLNHTCFASQEGKINCFGRNYQGQLGSSESQARKGSLTDHDPSFSVVRGGGSHSCGIAPDGKLYCWGWNMFGQLGNGSTENQTLPVMVNLDGEVVETAPGRYFTVAKTRENRFFYWGALSQDGKELPYQKEISTPLEWHVEKLKAAPGHKDAAEL